MLAVPHLSWVKLSCDFAGDHTICFVRGARGGVDLAQLYLAPNELALAWHYN